MIELTMSEGVAMMVAGGAVLFLVLVFNIGRLVERKHPAGCFYCEYTGEVSHNDTGPDDTIPCPQCQARPSDRRRR